MKTFFSLFFAVVLGSFGLHAQASGTERGLRITAAAQAQVGVTTDYDPAYVTLAYPGGDVPARTGVCSDVVVRALRKAWGLRRPDPNIDHRRVPNLMRYFERKQIALAEKLTSAETYFPGDIVAWRLEGGLFHVGVVSDRKSGRTPLVIHNIGRGAKEEDVLFAYTVIGHYRIK